MRRLFQIACSAVCVNLGLLLVALWIHSYFAEIILVKWNGRAALIAYSGRGRISLEHNIYVSHDSYVEIDPITTAIPYRFEDNNFLDRRFFSRIFHWDHSEGVDTVTFPYWLPIALLAALAVAPWFRWRFSVRTLLIAMTLVAVVLGFTVYTLKQ